MTVKDIYREYKVTIRGEIVGIAAVPENAATAPGVLLLHGFASHKDEVGGMYKRLAEALATKGIAALRIDFRGWGESAGDMADTTAEQQLEDAQAAYTYLTRMHTVDSTRVGIVGFRFGGGIAVLCAAQHPGQYTSMVLWSSVGDFKTDQIRRIGQSNFDTALSDGIVTVDLGWRAVTLKESFFRNLDRFDLQAAISTYTGALLVIAGSADPLAAHVDLYVANAQGQAKEAFVVDGADQSQANTVIEKTVSWLRKTL